MQNNPEKVSQFSFLSSEGIPNFKEITPQLINKEFPLLLKELNRKFNEIEQSLNESNRRHKSLHWQEVMSPLHQIEERLRWSWGVICHLNSVCNTPELRDAHAFIQPKVVRFSNRLGQSKIIFKALISLRDQSTDKLDETQKRILEIELLSMKKRGVGLKEDIQNEFNSDSERLAALSTTFSNNVLDATKQWSLLLTKKSEVDGLPNSVLEILALSAKEAGDRKEEKNTVPTAEKGPWRIGLDMPRYIPFMTHASRRDLRELLYKEYISRASKNEVDNRKIIEEILKIRKRQANRLGYQNWADLSLASKMAKNTSAVEDLLEELRVAAMPAAKKELDDLQKCAIINGAQEAINLAPWDIYFWSERLKQERFDFNQEALRPWFPLPQVLKGLFNLCERLFDITFEKVDGDDVPVWHEDVQFFKVLDQDKSPLAYFYLDPYSRPQNKRGGAWMDECLGRNKSKDGETILPVAYLVCNQTPPSEVAPSLMSFEEVETLFHEFGHGLQHMLTKVDYPQAAGINNVEWDAVELPSQFMENWCLDQKTLLSMAKHWQTGVPLEEKEFKKLKDSHTFNAGLTTLRQVHFALTDLRLHSKWGVELGITPDELRREIAQTTSIISPIKKDQFLCAFSHIFAGGYAAGYYSYKWAEVLSADAYAAFEENSQSDKNKIKSIGKRFRETILSLGGSKSPEEIFIAFRGRPPKTTALIRQSGLSVN